MTIKFSDNEQTNMVERVQCSECSRASAVWIFRGNKLHLSARLHHGGKKHEKEFSVAELIEGAIKFSPAELFDALARQGVEITSHVDRGTLDQRSLKELGAVQTMVG